MKHLSNYIVGVCWLLAAVGVATLSSCSPHPPKELPPIEAVVAVYFHEANTYSVTIRGEAHELVTRQLKSAQAVHIYDDVPETQSMFVTQTAVDHFLDGDYYIYGIHVHSIKDINSANWDHGKQGSGNTTRIAVEAPLKQD